MQTVRHPEYIIYIYNTERVSRRSLALAKKAAAEMEIEVWAAMPPVGIGEQGREVEKAPDAYNAVCTLADAEYVRVAAIFSR